MNTVTITDTGNDIEPIEPIAISLKQLWSWSISIELSYYWNNNAYHYSILLESVTSKRYNHGYKYYGTNTTKYGYS